MSVRSSRLLVFATLLILCLSGIVFANNLDRISYGRPWGLAIPRGGGGGGRPTADATVVEEYVAAVEKRDAQDRADYSDTDASSPEDGHDDDDKDKQREEHSKVDGDEESTQRDSSSSEHHDLDFEATGVGVKSHHKKSNAVGDPDGDSSDDSDDSDDWDDFEEELEDLDLLVEPTEVQVEVEVMEDDTEDEATTSSSGGGGVGIRLGRLNRRKTKTKEWKSKQCKATREQANMLEAWTPHVYLPLNDAAISYLSDNARSIDAASRMRLDRRTLYACLLLEWLHVSSSNRKFLDTSTSQLLQAALSLASQPMWRKSFPRASAVRLYNENAEKGCTLSMQETIVMSLAHSLGAGMVILDDSVLSTVRQQMSELDYPEEDLKPAALVQGLLSLAREGKIPRTARGGGSISSCMQRDLAHGLDDPFDDHASSSCEVMSEWEEKWAKPIRDNDSKGDNKPQALPLVIFLRTQASSSLLKNKSVVDLLMQECRSDESRNLLVLGKGINAATVSLPEESSDRQHDAHHSSQRQGGGGGAAGGGGAPWFGFSPQNQNASGNNDPEGSRRFNIFLARTMDPDGNPGILGAIAPPQAGNLFPHMMAMQARERLQQHSEDSPVKAELERWAGLLQQQLQSQGGHTPPQFFNASFAPRFGNADGNNNNPLASPPGAQQPSSKVIQEALQQALSEMLDRLAQMNDEGVPDPTSVSDLSPDVNKAFAQLLRNESLRRGISENLARAAPALSDPKCQGVMLSVYVPPPTVVPNGMNREKLPETPPDAGPKGQNNMAGWFQKILNNQDEQGLAEDDGEGEEEDDRRRKFMRQKRVRTLAAAAAVEAATNAEEARKNKENKLENKAERNLAKLEAQCRAVGIKVPSDPVRGKSWENWIARERGAVVFRLNRKALNEELDSRNLSLERHTGTRGAGSALRQMLSVRDISDDMEDVIKCAVELEAAKSQRQPITTKEENSKGTDLDVDITLSQLMVNDGEDNAELVATEEDRKEGIQYLQPSSLETALTMTCRISPSPSGGMFLSSTTPASHRTREEIMALAQDKHERALVSQVVSPQDIGVTYDMIGGLSDVKELLRQSITYPLKFPHLYSEGIAREAVKGVLLFGPPGTGKTMLAKAVATEGGASFLSVDASSVENKWLGESEKNAKAVFTLARRLAPCVIFIDEVDSLLSSREGTSDDSAHGTLTSVKTTIMSEWDGLNSGTNGNGEAGSDRVIVIGSTNRPYDLDEAVLRRFPRRILVDLPDLETRKEILEVTLAENRLHHEVNLTKIAEGLEGYTGSDIKEVCREAVVQISHEQARLLDQGLSDANVDLMKGSLQRLRPVTVDDFDKALSKLKRSVSEKGRELARVWEWNDEYGEIKKEKKNHLSHLMNMYL